MRLLSVLALSLALPLALAACAGDNDPAEIPTPPADQAPASGANPVTTPPETPEAADHATGGEHAHGSPHGGTVKTAGSGHLELVISGSNLLVYPLDANEAALPVEGITGAQIILQPQGGRTQPIGLTPMGDHLMATVPEGVGAYTAVVSVPVAGEARSARFEVGLDGDFDHAH